MYEHEGLFCKSALSGIKAKSQTWKKQELGRIWPAQQEKKTRGGGGGLTHGLRPVWKQRRSAGLGDLALLRRTRRQRAAGAVNASRDERAVVLVLVNQDDGGGLGVM